MRPVLRCCFLASYVLQPALGNASVPVSNGPFDSFYHNPLEPHSIPILNLKAVSHAPNCLDILRLDVLNSISHESFLICTVTVAISPIDSISQILLNNSSFVNTWFGFSGKEKVRRSNSLVVKAFSSPLT